MPGMGKTGSKRLTMAAAAVGALAGGLALANDPKKGDFLQDYVTCGKWAEIATADGELHAAIGRWMIDYLRRHSPSGLEALPDKAILEVVQRQCAIQPSRSLSVAVFLSGAQLPD